MTNMAVYIIAFPNDNSNMILNENVSRKIIPIAGGKGGVGKSIIAVNMALSLAKNGKKTVLVDLDLSGSNIHTLLGVKNTKPGIGNIISGLKASVSELVCPTKWENLYYIPGDVHVYGVGEITQPEKILIINGLLETEADYIILDLGGGTSFTVLDFFLVSNSGLIITTPQTTSVMNAYAFLKNYVLRFLQRAFASNKGISKYLNSVVKEQNQEDRKTMSEIMESITKISIEDGEKASAFLDVLQPKLILNKINSASDIVIAIGLRDLCKKNLSINIECLGTVLETEIVNRSSENLTPFVHDFPEHIVTNEVHRISQKILQSGNFPQMPLELDYYSDSYELAHIETENDIAIQQSEKKSGENTSEFEVDQLLELIRLQQGKIQELQGTLRMLSIGQ